MTIAYVGETVKGTQSASAGTLPLTVATAPGAGSLVVARVGCFDATSSLSSITDGKGNTWFIAINTSSGSRRPAIAYTMQDVAKLTTADAITFHWAAAISFAAIIIDEFTGIAASPLDQTATGTATLTSRSGGTTSATTQAAELVIGAFELGNTESSLTPGAGYSAFATSFLAQSTNVSISGEYKIVAATGTQNPTATGGTSGSSNGVAATFKADLTVPARSRIVIPTGAVMRAATR